MKTKMAKEPFCWINAKIHLLLLTKWGFQWNCNTLWHPFFGLSCSSTRNIPAEAEVCSKISSSCEQKLFDLHIVQRILMNIGHVGQQQELQSQENVSVLQSHPWNLNGRHKSMWIKSLIFQDWYHGFLKLYR